jgi:hypothetical protein
MAADKDDLFQEVGEPGSATTLAGSGYTVGDASIVVESAASHPSTTGYTFAIDRVQVVNGQQVRIDGTYCEFVGVKTDATTITQVEKTFGDDQDYPAGATTRVYIPVASTRENRLVQGVLVHSNQDGTLKADSVGAAQLSTAAVTATKIQSQAVTTTKLADAAVTADKLANGGASSPIVTASETTTSTSPTDLATVTDTVTVTVGANGVVLLGLHSYMFNNTSGAFTQVTFEASGANTIAASADKALRYKSANSSNDIQTGTTFRLTGLNPGATTFKMKYSVTAGTGTFANRHIWAEPR